MLLALIVILILLRNGMVIFDMWSVQEGGDLPEGLIHGNFAFDILNSTWRGWPAYLYRVRGHLGNELLVGIMAIPLYLMFGNSLFVLCQVPILYSIGILSLIYYLCRRWIDKEIAIIAATLFVCVPVTIQGCGSLPLLFAFRVSFFFSIGNNIFFQDA